MRLRRGEIDIVADDDRTLVFVEVKQRKSTDFGGGEFAINARKRHRLVLAAQEFLLREKLHSQPCRFDAIIIDTGVEPPQFTHIENAFGDDRR